MRLLVITLLTLSFSAYADQPTGYYHSLFANQHKMTAHIFGKLLEPDQTEKIPAIIVMKNQADLSKATEFTTKSEKNAYVVKELWDLAKTDQEDIVNFLSSQDTGDLKFRRFYIFNGIAVYNASQSLLNEIAARDDVKKLYFNPTVRNDVREEVAELNLLSDFSSGKNKKPTQSEEGITPGIIRTKAHELWKLGIKGQGVVVGIQDTGIEYDHPAIVKKYRGYSEEGFDHSLNWHDSIKFKVSSSTSRCGYDSKFPCDDNGHGTHVTGTVTGDDENGKRIGMAPDTKWIGCRNMDAGDGTPASYIECYEFFLAPYDQSVDPLEDFDNLHPEMSADVISNSWGCPRSEGCDKDEILLSVEAIKAAGIVNVVSAGNEGRAGCGTIGAQPATLSHLSFTVGAYDVNRRGIASFSSRGPSVYDQSKGPDVVAPGVSVLSSVPGGGYSAFSGTSMAGPHVAGLVSLLLSARPDLKGEVDTIENAIRNTAEQMTTTQGCGDDSSRSIPNNTFGHGMIDAVQAYEKLK